MEDRSKNYTEVVKVFKFKYLESLGSRTTDCAEDVNVRKKAVWTYFYGKNKPQKLKWKLYHTVIRPAVTYASKSWARQ